MNILYAFLIVLVVYPAMGTLLFNLVENLKASTKIKILMLTFGIPLLTGTVIWFVGLTLNREISETGIVFVAGTLLRLPFSDRKYLTTVVRESGAVTIEYFTELLSRKRIRLAASDIGSFTQSAGRRLIDKPRELTVSMSGRTLNFVILDKTSKVSL